MDIKYNYAITDDIPVIIRVNTYDLQTLSANTNNPNKMKLDWSRLQQADINNYCIHSDELLKQVSIPTEALACKDTKCTHNEHIDAISVFYNDIIRGLNTASEPLYKFTKCAGAHRPGCNEHVEELHNIAMDAFLMSKENGKLKQGLIF